MKDIPPWKPLQLVNDLLLAHSGNDPYWTSRMEKARQRSDEPEIWYVIHHFCNEHTIFVDGGANIGIWSAAAAAKIQHPNQVIAVEASPEVFPQLLQNRALNGNGFTAVNKALWNKSGETLPFYEYDRHVINSLTPRADQPVHRQTQVPTVTVDDLVDEALMKAPDATSIIVKLDVERAECEALEGTAKTLKGKNALIIYEDTRTMGPTSQTTANILRQGFHVYYIAPNHRVQSIAGAEELAAIKVPPRTGYNFLACNPGSSFDVEFQRLCEESKQRRDKPVTNDIG